MKKDDLICEYCKTGISLEDKRCPNCGANCTKIVNEYKKKRQEIEDNLTDRKMAMVEDTFKKVGSAVKISFVIPIIIFVLAIGMAVFIGIMVSKNNNDNKVLFGDEKQKKEEKVSVKYNELAETNNLTIILDKYEVYNHVSDKFPDQYNTPEGYKKVAFNFVINNKGDKPLDLIFDNKISGTADDYSLEETDLEICMFCKAIEGKEKYSALPKIVIEGNKIQGYVGYLVPINAKALKFNIGSLVTIEMDNPVYNS